MGALTSVALIAHGNLQANRLFDPASSRDSILERFYLLQKELQSAGMVCQTADMYVPHEIDVLIFHDLLNELGTIIKTIKANPLAQLVYVPNEPAFVAPMHDEKILPHLPVDAVMTWNDRIAGEFLHVIKCNIGQSVINSKNIPNFPFFNKKFICSIFANKPSNALDSLYAERIQTIVFFSQQPLGMDLYGIGWDTSPCSNIRNAYRGQCENKKEVQQKYKFCIAYENVGKIPGLITEKIFDCFAAGTVPIYLGAPNIEQYIPKSCFVDFRQFADYHELYHYLSNMPEGEYQKYLDAAIAFIDSPQYRQFTSMHYAELVTKEIKLLITRKNSARSLIGMKWLLLKLIVKHPQVLRNWRLFRHFVIAMVTVW